MISIRDELGRFVKGHKSCKGIEKGWFKKGIIPKTAFKKGCNAWNKSKQMMHRGSFKKRHG